MKKQVLALLSILMAFLVQAKSDTALYWNYAATAWSGGTNEVKAIKSDNKGNIYYSGYGYEISPGNRHGLIIGKMNDSLQYVWKKHYFGYPQAIGTQQLVVDDSSMYILGIFHGNLEFPNDTLKTASPNYDEPFMVCLNALNGEVRWAKVLEFQTGYRLQFDGNNDLILAYSSIKGEQKYNGVILDTVNNPNYFVRGYAYLTLNKHNGTLKNHCFGEYNMLAAPDQNHIMGRTVRGLILTSGGIPEITPRELNLDNNTITNSTKKITLVSSGVVKIFNSFYHPTDKSWTLILNHNNQDIKIGDDTIKLPTLQYVNNYKSLVRLDSNLNMLKYITYNSVLNIDYQIATDTNILITFGVNGDGFFVSNGIVDTIRYKGITTSDHNGYFIARCNLNLENFTFSRFSVWDKAAPPELKSIELDNKGNFYAAAFHNKDIFVLPYLFKAANKSWKHLSVIAKYGDTKGSTTISIRNINSTRDIVIYPNPTSTILNITTVSEIENIHILDISGKLMLASKDKTVDVSTLKSGIYLISITTNNTTQNLKFIKQ